MGSSVINVKYVSKYSFDIQRIVYVFMYSEYYLLFMVIQFSQRLLKL